MEDKGSSPQLMLALVRTNNILCVGHSVSLCVLFPHGLVRSNYGKFINRLRTRGGLYLPMELQSGEETFYCRSFIFTLLISL